MERKMCQCEHYSHFPDDIITDIVSHEYEKEEAVMELVTSEGKFFICSNCFMLNHMVLPTMGD